MFVYAKCSVRLHSFGSHRKYIAKERKKGRKEVTIPALNLEDKKRNFHRKRASEGEDPSE